MAAPVTPACCASWSSCVWVAELVTARGKCADAVPYTCRTFQVMDEIVYRTARGMAAEGAPFRGTLFAGLMIKDGKVGVTWGLARLDSKAHE